jgi:hypothetical protein
MQQTLDKKRSSGDSLATRLITEIDIYLILEYLLLCIQRLKYLKLSNSSAACLTSYLLHVVQTGPGTHPASDRMNTGGSFYGREAAGAWSWPLTSN